MPWLGHSPLLFIHRVALTAPSTSCHWSEVTQSCPSLRDPMDCSPPGSSTHGVFQARVLEWVPSPSLCSLCLNACLWPLGDLVEPPHNSYVCVCVCVCHTGQLVGFGSLSRDQTQVLSSESTESQSLDHQGIPITILVFPEAAQTSANRTQQILAEKAHRLNSGPREEFLGV